MNKFKHYIAFSIHGTNAFLVAGTDSENVVEDTPGLKRTFSRLAVEEQHGIKYIWSSLNNKKTGEPYQNAGLTIKRFRELEKLGWKIDEDSYKAFCRAHFQSAAEYAERLKAKANQQVH